MKIVFAAVSVISSIKEANSRAILVVNIRWNDPQLLVSIKNMITVFTIANRVTGFSV